MMKHKYNIYFLVIIVLLIPIIKYTKSNPYCRLCPQFQVTQNHLCWMIHKLFEEGTSNATYIPFDDETRHAAIMLLNSKRNIFANDFNVSNMNAVNWDRELEHLAHLFVMQPTENLPLSYMAYSDVTFERFNPIHDFKCCRTLHYNLDFILYIKNFENGSGNEPHEMMRVIRSQSAYDVFRLFMDTWSISENPFQMTVFNVMDSFHFESRYRLIFWGELDVIGCGIVNTSKYHFEPLTEKALVVPRLIMHCYFGSTSFKPRQFHKRVFERGAPCSLCQRYKDCNPQFEGLCGKIKAPQWATYFWNNDFWHNYDKAMLASSSKTSKLKKLKSYIFYEINNEG